MPYRLSLPLRLLLDEEHQPYDNNVPRQGLAVTHAEIRRSLGLIDLIWTVLFGISANA
jgi:hypothetical protein